MRFIHVIVIREVSNGLPFAHSAYDDESQAIDAKSKLFPNPEHVTIKEGDRVISGTVGIDIVPYIPSRKVVIEDEKPIGTKVDKRTKSNRVRVHS